MKIEGLGGISAEVVADSVNIFGDRLTTLRLHYHRFIHAEFLRHRMFSHSVSSSRAIPVPKMIEQVEDDYACPIYWGKNQPGMTAKEELEQPGGNGYDVMWGDFANANCDFAREMNENEIHKQVTNRVLEPFQFINQVVSGTDYSNFFYLRLDGAAQPEIQELARVMYEAMNQSTPITRRDTHHLPYITEDMREQYSIEEQIMISASICAQSSYRLSDPSLVKAKMIYKKLVESRPLHASPFEHMAKPFSEEEYKLRLKHTHEFKNALIQLGFEEKYADTKARIMMYEGNYRGWAQSRKSMPEETCYEY